jgi:4'-phosphopantetheinyl transferase
MLVADKGIEVVVTRLGTDDDTVRDSAWLLSAGERWKASRFVLDRDRRRFVARRAQLRKLIGERLTVSPASIALSHGPLGKPALAAPFDRSGLRFNVSHSEDLAVYAFSRTNIGVDVEAIRATDGADRVAALAFSRREYEMYRGLPAHLRPLAFLNGWTRKEAFVKAVGCGLAYPLDAFDVSLTPDEPASILRVGDMDGANCGWRLASFFPAPGFVAAVVTRAAS